MGTESAIVVARSTTRELESWRQLAREVEAEFGAPMADNKEWAARLRGHIAAGTAWSAYLQDGAPMGGGMWLAAADPNLITIRWLAVARAQRRLGLARALVETALNEAEGRPVNVVTFGDGHPMAAAAEAARDLYLNMGFEPSAQQPPDGPDGTPRAAFRYTDDT